MKESLADKIAGILKGSAGMKVAEIVEALEKQGHKFTAKATTPQHSVWGVLCAGKGKRFMQPGKGLWALKSEAEASLGPEYKSRIKKKVAPSKVKRKIKISAKQISELNRAPSNVTSE